MVSYTLEWVLAQFNSYRPLKLDRKFRLCFCHVVALLGLSQGILSEDNCFLLVSSTLFSCLFCYIYSILRRNEDSKLRLFLFFVCMFMVRISCPSAQFLLYSIQHRFFCRYHSIYDTLRHHHFRIPRKLQFRSRLPPSVYCACLHLSPTTTPSPSTFPRIAHTIPSSSAVTTTDSGKFQTRSSCASMLVFVWFQLMHPSFISSSRMPIIKYPPYYTATTSTKAETL